MVGRVRGEVRVLSHKKSDFMVKVGTVGMIVGTLGTGFKGCLGTIAIMRHINTVINQYVTS